MKPGSFAVVGAAESTEIGKVPDRSSLGLGIDGAVNALNDAGLKASDIDGLTVGYMPPGDLAQLMGVYPKWVDNTVVGGCSWMFQLRNAMAAIHAGYCETVLIIFGESGRSHRAAPNVYGLDSPGSLAQQFTLPYTGPIGRPALFALNLVRYMREYGLTEEQLAMVPVVQREWANLNPRASRQGPLTVRDVLETRVIAWPIRQAMCCLVSDAGGALVVTAAERAKDFPTKPVYVLGTGAAIETGIANPEGVRDPLHPGLVPTSGRAAFTAAGLTVDDIDHLMVYDAFAHNPIFGLEGLGFVPTGEAGAFIEDGHTRPGGSLPMNTNGGGLSYAHSGSYGMLCMLESIRQVRGEADAQVEGVRTSLAHGWGGFWSACSTVIFGNEVP